MRAVSLPCLELFGEQPESYRREVLPSGIPRLGVEAGVKQGLGCLLCETDRFLGLDRFGASAPWEELAKHFGFTPERVIDLAREMI